MAIFLSTKEAVKLIPSDVNIGLEGFIGIGAPEELLIELEKRFLADNLPKNISLIYASGIGDGKDRGVNHIAHEGLLKRVICGHWGLTPKLHPLVNNNKIEAYNFPQGVLAQSFRDMAAKRPRHITRIGLGTFVDPDMQGGKLNSISIENLVEKISIDGKDYLSYKINYVDIALLKGSYSDEDGNISFEEEPLTLQALSVAMAVRNNGGKVFVQVKGKVKAGSIPPRSVTIPANFVDYVCVVSDLQNHMQTFSTQYNSDLLKQNLIFESANLDFPMNERKIIARRCAMILSKKEKVLNYGIGLPEAVPLVLKEENADIGFTPVVEPGIFGGTPLNGLNFGSAIAPSAIIDQPYMFDFYDGGGIDMTFLGLAECDSEGNINVSKFGPKIPGCGGFINITQSAKQVVFCGAFTASGLEVKADNGKLKIIKEGKVKKFVKSVEQITFSGENARSLGKNVYYVTERAVFKMESDGITLIEIAPGVDLEKDVLGQMDFKPKLAKKIGLMDSRIFADALMNLKIKEI